MKGNGLHCHQHGDKTGHQHGDKTALERKILKVTENFQPLRNLVHWPKALMMESNSIKGSKGGINRQLEGHAIPKISLHTHKNQLNCTNGTKDGNLNNYPDDVDTLMANLLLITKFNNVIFTPRAWFVNADLLYIYLMMLKCPEYARLDLRNIPEEIIDDINLCKIASPNKWVYIMVIHEMYKFPQEGCLHPNLLKERLNCKGYFQSKKVPGQWKWKDHSIQFV